MKIAVIGAGAMGGVFGGYLSGAGNDVTLIDVRREVVEEINSNGLRLEDVSGGAKTIRVRAATNPAEVGPVDLVLVLVKCYDTEAAVRSATPLLGQNTVVLSLQDGLGNALLISGIVGAERVLVGVTYHSATALGRGHVQHEGSGMTFIGEMDGKMSDRLSRIVETFKKALFEVTMISNVLKEIWSKLALDACTMPTSALLGFHARQLIEHDGTIKLMRGLLREALAVAKAQGIVLEVNERWAAITGFLKRVAEAKTSMLQDVEKGRRTEIDVINGAIVEAGKRLNIPTPYNEAMVWLIRSLEETF